MIPPSLQARSLMKSTLRLTLAGIAAAFSMNAQEPAKPDMEKVSYFIGRQIGGQFKQQKLDINLENFTAAVQDAVSGKPSKYSEKELEAAMGVFEKYMQSRMAEIQAEMQKEASAKAGEAKAAGTKFLAENGKREGVKTTASGLQYEVIKAGDGPKPVATDKVNVHYHGTLISGKVFDSSVERGMPITFGVQEVIKGWTEALQLMPVGSKWRIYIPSQLAYGEQGAGGDIGPNEALIFDVELLGIVK